jgi:hypothetical protein
MGGTDYTPTLIDHMLASLEDERQVTKRLDDWERTFLASVGGQWRASRSLTRPQCEKLEEIYAEKTA